MQGHVTGNGLGRQAAFAAAYAQVGLDRVNRQRAALAGFQVARHGANRRRAHQPQGQVAFDFADGDSAREFAHVRVAGDRPEVQGEAARQAEDQVAVAGHGQFVRARRELQHVAVGLGGNFVAFPAGHAQVARRGINPNLAGRANWQGFLEHG